MKFLRHNTGDTCPEDWNLWSGNCYKFVRENEPIKWTSAEESCKLLGGHLASISDENEMNFIQSLLIENEAARWSKCYIGKKKCYKCPQQFFDFPSQSLKHW